MRYNTMENFHFDNTIFKRYVFTFFSSDLLIWVCVTLVVQALIEQDFLHGLFVDSLGKFDPSLPLGLIKQVRYVYHWIHLSSFWAQDKTLVQVAFEHLLQCILGLVTACDLVAFFQRPFFNFPTFPSCFYVPT